MTTQAPPLSPPPLSRQPPRPRAGLPLVGDLGLARGRVHEFCGPARRTLALIAARGCAGPVIWIAPGWQGLRLNPDGIRPLIQPGRLIFIAPQRAADLLWCLEEALRAGAAALVVGDLPEPPALVPVRRLHLAAETGAREGRVTPTGLILTPGDGGAQGAESRWHLAPRPDDAPDATSWQLDLRRARNAPPAAWTLTAREGTDGRDAFRLERAGAVGTETCGLGP